MSRSGFAGPRTCTATISSSWTFTPSRPAKWNPRGDDSSVPNTTPSACSSGSISGKILPHNPSAQQDVTAHPAFEFGFQCADRQKLLWCPRILMGQAAEAREFQAGPVRHPPDEGTGLGSVSLGSQLQPHRAGKTVVPGC